MLSFWDLCSSSYSHVLIKISCLLLSLTLCLLVRKQFDTLLSHEQFAHLQLEAPQGVPLRLVGHLDLQQVNLTHVLAIQVQDDRERLDFAVNHLADFVVEPVVLAVEEESGAWGRFGPVVVHMKLDLVLLLHSQVQDTSWHSENHANLDRSAIVADHESPLIFVIFLVAHDLRFEKLALLLPIVYELRR